MKDPPSKRDIIFNTYKKKANVEETACASAKEAVDIGDRLTTAKTLFLQGASSIFDALVELGEVQALRRESRSSIPDNPAHLNTTGEAISLSAFVAERLKRKKDAPHVVD